MEGTRSFAVEFKKPSTPHHRIKEANEPAVQKEINLLVLLRLFVDKNIRQNSLINNKEGWRKPAFVK